MNGYQKYKEKSIYSMSGPELLLLLYDEAIKRLTRAEMSLEDKDYKDFEDCLDRVSRIIRYLIDILDMSYPISRDLRRIHAGRERQKDEIGRIRNILSELREAFDQASRVVGDNHIVREKSVFG